MDNSTNSAFSFGDVCRAAMRHRTKAAVVFAMVLFLFAVGLQVWPRKYRSEGKLFVKLGRQSIALDPTATTGQTVSVNESREIEINSIVEMLSSRAMAERVVDVLGPEMINQGTDPRPGANKHLKSRERYRENAVTSLFESTAIHAPKNTTVIEVKCTASSPELAQKFTATLMDAYLEEHVRVHRTAGSHDFFLAQSKLLQGDLNKATEELRLAKNELGLTSIEGQRGTLQDQIATIQGQIISTETELAAAQAKIAAISEKVDYLPERLTTQDVTGFPNVGADNMRTQLFQLQLLERELLSKYTEVHPQVVAIRLQVEEAKKIHDKVEPVRSQTTSAINPARETLKLSLLTEQANVESLMARATKLQEQHGQLLEELRDLNNAEVRIAELQRNVDMADGNYRSYADNLEQARIDDALQGQRISNVNIAQPANYISKPISPKTSMVAVMGLIAAVVFSFATVLIAEQLSLSPPQAITQRSADRPVRTSTPRHSHTDVHTHETINS